MLGILLSLKPSDEKSEEHPCVILFTNAARVWFEHASLGHMPVNQVLIGPTTEASEPPRRTGTNPAAFRH
jgi:hypothetical protein